VGSGQILGFATFWLIIGYHNMWIIIKLMCFFSVFFLWIIYDYDYVFSLFMNTIQDERSGFFIGS